MEYPNMERPHMTCIFTAENELEPYQLQVRWYGGVTMEIGVMREDGSFEVFDAFTRYGRDHMPPSLDEAEAAAAELLEEARQEAPTEEG